MENALNIRLTVYITWIHCLKGIEHKIGNDPYIIAKLDATNNYLYDEFYCSFIKPAYFKRVVVIYREGWPSYLTNPQDYGFVPGEEFKVFERPEDVNEDKIFKSFEGFFATLFQPKKDSHFKEHSMLEEFYRKKAEFYPFTKKDTHYWYYMDFDTILNCLSKLDIEKGDMFYALSHDQEEICEITIE